MCLLVDSELLAGDDQRAITFLALHDKPFCQQLPGDVQPCPTLDVDARHAGSTFAQDFASYGKYFVLISGPFADLSCNFKPLVSAFQTTCHFPDA